MTLKKIDFKEKIYTDEDRKKDEFSKHDKKRTVTTYEIGPYTVKHVQAEFITGLKLEDFSIRTHKDYYPEIIYHEGWGGDEKSFQIQTTAYGSKNTDEIQEIINGYREAIEVVNFLTIKFIGKNNNEDEKEEDKIKENEDTEEELIEDFTRELQAFVNNYSTGADIKVLIEKAYRYLSLKYDVYIINDRYLGIKNHNYKLRCNRKGNRWIVQEF